MSLAVIVAGLPVTNDTRSSAKTKNTKVVKKAASITKKCKTDLAKEKKFSFKDMSKVMSIVIMEQSPKKFHTDNDHHIH